MAQSDKKGSGRNVRGAKKNSKEKDAPIHEKHALVHKNYVSVREAANEQKQIYAFGREHIREEKRESFFIVGFDTEYKTPSNSFDNKQIQEGKAKYEVLSYQFYAKNETGEEWSGLILPDDQDRVSFSEFITYVIAKGATEVKFKTVPQNLYLVAHYNRADIPAFDDRDNLIARLNNIRKSLVSYDLPIKIKVTFPLEVQTPDKGDDLFLSVYIRDTILLAPAGARSLAEIGKLVDCDKIILSHDPKREKYLKENMDVLLAEDWELFRKYALLDAEICVRYFTRLMDQYEHLMGTRRLPTALSNIGIKLLLNEWDKREQPLDRYHAVGKQLFSEQYWNRQTQQFLTKKRAVYLEEVNWFIDFVTECYHGGRNEQFWFGPSYEQQWSDYDLTGAYPTAMALIDLPKWNEIRHCTDVKKLTPETLGFACVDFEFPADTRYPTLPVRTNNGIVFPLKGRSYCSSPEISLAVALGAKLAVRHGCIIPVDKRQKVFFPFLKSAIANRLNAKTPLENQFWKELTNSCYGKTAQGLRRKRVFNIQKERNQQLPESNLTNPYYASYITSFVRAVVGEIINAIPQNRMVFSVTTDGFVTDATDAEMRAAQAGPLCKMFSQARKQLTGRAETLSEKHSVQRVLGWKTRGQATLLPGTKEGTPNYLLAKAGIQPPPWSRTAEEQNDYIVPLFFERTGDQKVVVDTNTSMRDMVLYHADLVKKTSVRRLNMEYDFKRRPYSVKEAEIVFGDKTYNHIAFSTRPWDTIEQFRTIRSVFDDRIKDANVRCMKTVDQFRTFVEYFDTKNNLPVGKGKYLRKSSDADLSRLKRDLCHAFKQGCAGLDAYSDETANWFVDVLLECGFHAHGIKIKRSDVENAGRKDFEPNSTPRTARVLECLRNIKSRLPELQVDQIVYEGPNEVFLSTATETQCEFIKRLKSARG